MRALAIASAALGCLSAGRAAAGPMIAVGYGTSHSTTPSSNGAPTATVADSLALIGRIPLGGAWSLQGEVGKVESTSDPDSGTMVSGVTMRSASALLVLDLGHGPIVPVLLAGIGADQTTPTAGSYATQDQTFTRHEGGIGLEYRSPGGLVLGADVRAGSRSGPTPGYSGGYHCAPNEGCPGDFPYAGPPASFPLGQYFTARVMLGARF